MEDGPHALCIIMMAYWRWGRDPRLVTRSLPLDAFVLLESHSIRPRGTEDAAPRAFSALPSWVAQGHICMLGVFENLEHEHG